MVDISSLPGVGDPDWGEPLRAVVTALNTGKPDTADLTNPATPVGAALSATYALVTSLAPSNGVDDSAAINQRLQDGKGGIVRGVPGESYLIAGTVFLPADTVFDMTTCTVKAADGWIDYPFKAECQKTAIMSPGTFTVTPQTTGGTLAAGTYYYSVSATTATGETMGCPTKTVTTTGATGSVVLTWASPTVPAGGGPITSYKVYGRLRANIAILLGTTTGLTFTDTGGAGTPATLPAVNSTFGRTAGITVRGGTWDFNSANRPCNFDRVTSGLYGGIGFELQHVDDLVFEGDGYFLNAEKIAIGVSDFGHIRTDDMHFDTDGAGCLMLGPGLSWTSKGVRATRAGDDMLCMSLAEWPTYAVSRGSVGKVVWKDIDATGVAAFARVLGGDGLKLDTLEIRNVHGTYSGQFRGGIYLWDNQDLRGWKNGTVIDKVVMADIHMKMCDLPVAPFPYGGAGQHAPIVLAGQHFKDVTLERITGSSITANRLKGLIEVHSGSSTDTTMLIDRLTISGCDTADVLSPYGLVTVRGGANIGTLNVARCGVTDSAGYSPLVKVYETGTRVHNLVISESTDDSVTTGGAMFELTNSATVDRLTIRDINGSGTGTYRLADIYAGTHLTAALLEGISSTVLPEAIRVSMTDAAVITLTNLYLPSIGSPPVRAGTGTSLTVLGGALQLPANRIVVYNGATMAALRVNGATLNWQLGQATLTPRAGDMLYNTNSGASCGVGVVVTDGTTWKNVYSGATWANA